MGRTSSGSSRSRAASSVRFRAPNLRRTFETWRSTVFLARNKLAAISGFVAPLATSRATSSSRAVRPASPWLAGRAGGPPRSHAERSHPLVREPHQGRRAHGAGAVSGGLEGRDRSVRVDRGKDARTIELEPHGVDGQRPEVRFAPHRVELG